MTLTALGAAHITAALAALTLGLLVVMAKKGSAYHRTIGGGYVTTMFGVNLTALQIYHLTGHFGVFHVFALISLFGIVSGMSAAIIRWRGWLNSHYRSMSFSYVGLLAAACSEAAVRVPSFHVRSANGAFAIGIAIALIFGVGGTILVRRLARTALTLPQT